MITLSIQSDKALIQVMSKNDTDLLGDAAALVAAYRDLTESRQE